MSNLQDALKQVFMNIFTILTACKYIHAVHVQQANISSLVYYDNKTLFCIWHFPMLHIAQETNILHIPDQVILATYGYSTMENVKGDALVSIFTLHIWSVTSLISPYLNYTPANNYEIVLIIW